MVNVQNAYENSEEMEWKNIVRQDFNIEIRNLRKRIIRINHQQNIL